MVKKSALSPPAANDVTVLGIDLAHRSWRDVGSATLSFTPGTEAAWTACRTDVIAWPDQPLSAEVIAAAIDHYLQMTGISAVSIDGPQGWRDPAAAPRRGVGRWSEYEARTPGKTGTIGTVYPRTYMPWVAFSIAVFRALTDRPHVTLVNDREGLLRAPPLPGQYYVLECFPTSTWRTSGLAPLPGHAKAPPAIVTACALTLQERFGLPVASITGEHDHLQAVVAALPAAALLGGPCEAVPRGEAAHEVPVTADTAAHRVEGLIWDARPCGWTKGYLPEGSDTHHRVPTRPGTEAQRSRVNLGSARQAHECLCGCGGVPKAGRFLPGHDAKLKGALRRRIIQGDETAREALHQLGWERFAPPRDQ